MQTPHNVVIPMQPYGKETARDARLLQVKDHVLWSLLSFTYANFCCMGFVAFLFSIKKLPPQEDGVFPPAGIMDTSYPREDYLPMTCNKQDPSPTIITVKPPVVPRDYMIWSVFNTIYMNLCCLGFVALAYSVKARDQKVSGDLEAAHRYGSKAKCYNILATVWNVVLPLVLIALVITGVLHLSKLAQESMDFLAYRLFPIDEDKK